MYRRRREKRRKLIQSFTLWHPMILLFLMFVLGACTHSKAEPVPMPTSAAIVSEAAESSSVPQASKAAAQDSPSICLLYTSNRKKVHGNGTFVTRVTLVSV